MGMGSIARRVGVAVVLGGALSAGTLVAQASAGATATANANFQNATGVWSSPPAQTGAVRASNSAQTTFRLPSRVTGFSSARSYADLSTGQLGVENITDSPGYGLSQAGAQFTDTLTFNLPSGMNSAVIPLKFLVNGSIGSGGGANYGVVIRAPRTGPVFLASAILYFGGRFAQTQAPIGHITSFNAGGVAGDFVAQRGVNYTILAKLGGRTQTDFYHTAAFSFPSLPPGVTFTSASGAFLGGGKTDGGVPEPASWALMLAGFLSLGAMLRVRRAQLGPAIH